MENKAEVKAKEIYRKMLLHIEDEVDAGDTPVGGTRHGAKQCAIIACEEMLKQDYVVGKTITDSEQIALFWLDVIKEINKL